MKTMKALVKSNPEKGIWMKEVPVPTVGANDVLIRVVKTATVVPICISISGMNGLKIPLKPP
jgi:D-arabinose 1-dehydrogenase-like Zn-dependent alcohol dehydrogenase